MEELTRMKAFLRLTEAVSGSRTLEEACEAGLDYVEQSLGVDRSSILLFDADGVMRFRSWRNLSDTYRRAVNGHSPWTPNTPDASPVVIPDVLSTDCLGPLQQPVTAEGIRALAFIPMRARGRLLGKLMLYSHAPHEYGRDELREAQGVADQIAMIVGHRDAHARAEELNDLLTAMLEHLPTGLAYHDAQGRARFVNRTLARMCGCEPAALLGLRTLEIVTPIAGAFADPGRALAWFTECESARVPARDVELRLANGRVIECSHLPIGSGASFRGHLWHVHDASDRRELEAQLLHAQKMESLGRLAGGVAHDFNNLLTAVIGYLDLVGVSLPRDSEEADYARQAVDAAEQAAGLTRQLLTFARRQPVQPAVHDFNGIVGRMVPMLRRLVPENIELVTGLALTPCWVRADAGQLEQVLVNLVFNARDAMLEGGRLDLATTEAEGHVILDVRDTGVGMDDATRQRIFEPFFTTKENGRGTGLGLATVYGVVQQCGGRIEVESVPGSGSRFRILLPSAPAPGARPVEGAGLGAPRGDETVLVVEDDGPVRGLVTVMLRRLGYAVLSAGDAEEALALSRTHAGRVQLLLTDIVMPGRSGRDLARTLRAERPEMRVLFMSGYAPDEAPAATAGREPFLPKPFSIETLGRTLREALHTDESEPAAPRA